MIIAHTTSPDETRKLAAALAELAHRGDLILLAGDLGAGKTVFAQGFGRGIGVTEPITSPTFTLARQYEGGRLILHHLDVYRLEQMQEVFDVGLPELLDEDAVILIEWGDAIIPALPADYLEIRFTYEDGSDDERRIAIHAVGPAWSARSKSVAAAVAPWGEDGSC